MATYPNRDRALRQLDRHQPRSLQALTDQELIAAGTARFGGPSPEVIAEAMRRIQESTAKIRSAFSAVRPLLPEPSQQV